MRKSIIILAFICTVLIACTSSHRNDEEVISFVSPDPFSGIKYDKAVAYDFRGNTGINLIESNGLLTKTVKKDLELDSAQLSAFKTILMDSTTFGDEWPTDFYPHLGIAFYKDNKIIDHLEVSLICNNIFASFNIPEKTKKPDLSNGLTKQGVNKILKFCRDLGFKQYLDSVIQNPN